MQPAAGGSRPAVHGEQPGGAAPAAAPKVRQPQGRPEMASAQAAAGSPLAGPAVDCATHPASTASQRTTREASGVLLPLGTPRPPPLPSPLPPAAGLVPGPAEPGMEFAAAVGSAAAAQAGGGGGEAAASTNAEADAPQSGAAANVSKSRGRRASGRTAAQLRSERNQPPKRARSRARSGSDACASFCVVSFSLQLERVDGRHPQQLRQRTSNTAPLHNGKCGEHHRFCCVVRRSRALATSRAASCGRWRRVCSDPP